MVGRDRERDRSVSAAGRLQSRRAGPPARHVGERGRLVDLRAGHGGQGAHRARGSGGASGSLRGRVKWRTVMMEPLPGLNELRACGRMAWVDEERAWAARPDDVVE